MTEYKGDKIMKSKAEITTDLEQLKAQAEDRKWRELHITILRLDLALRDKSMTFPRALDVVDNLRKHLELPSFSREPHVGAK